MKEKQKSPLERELNNEPLNEKSDGITVQGYTGTWYVIDINDGYGPRLFLLESEEDGDECAHLIVDEHAVAVWDGCYNDWDDLDDALDGTLVFVKSDSSTNIDPKMEFISSSDGWNIYREIGWKGAFG